MSAQTRKLITIALVASILVLSCIPAGSAKASDTLDFSFEMTGGQSEARLVLDKINSFRTGGQAWYWNPDDQTKTTPGVLSALVYNYDLEKIAMKRAAELALRFSHTRPSGASWVDAYPEFGVSQNNAAENIAKGYSTADSVYTAWLEEDKSYSGQGHRRSFLGNYTSVGVGHVVYEGVHYWALELSGENPSGSVSQPLDSKTVFQIALDPDDIDSVYLIPDLSDGRASLFDEDALVLIGEEIDCKYTLSANCGESFSFAPYSVALKVFGNSRTVLAGGLSFTSSDPGTLTVSGDEVAALGEGVSVLRTSFAGFELSLPVIVSHDYDEGVPGTLPTCTEPGTIVYTCKGCGDAYVDVVPATGHHFVDFTIPACVGEDGVKGQICEDCGQRENEELIKGIGEISLKETEFTYKKGKKFKPAVDVLDTTGEVIDPSFYTVKYKGYTKVGTAKATVTFDGISYVADAELSYVIYPKDTSFTKLTSKKGAIGFKWTRVLKQNTGYEIEYSLKKNFKKSETIVITDKTKKTYTLKKLKNKKMYYVRIRTFHVVDGKTYRSSWSGVRTVRTG